MPDAVDTVICVPDDGWRDRPKHVQQFARKINCVYFEVLLTVQHLSIILVINQLNA